MSKKNDIASTFSHFSTNCIWLFSLVAIAFLSFLSFTIASSVSPNYDEIVLFETTNILTLILTLLALFCISFLAFVYTKSDGIRSKLENHALYKSICQLMLMGIFIVSMIWVLSTQYIPGADQLEIQTTALAFSQHDYSSCEPGQYIARFPHQLGIVWFSYYVGLLFGFKNYLAFQAINALSVLTIYAELARISKRIGLENASVIALLAFGYIFLPLILMTSFVYGNLPSLALSLLAMRAEMDFFSTRKMSSLLVCAFAISLSVLLKTNSLVVMIAMVLIALLNCFNKEVFVSVVLILAMVFCVFASQKAIVDVTESITGESLHEGMSGMGFVAMGLQDGPRGPGWFSDLNFELYVDANYDSKTHFVLAKNEIAESVGIFCSDPEYALDFFIRKEASLWCNPDFQTLWTPQIREQAIDPPGWANLFERESFQRAIGVPLKVFQTCIYSFAAVGLIIQRKWLTAYPSRLLPLLAFLGGFLCHSIWEAKAYYAITYFVFLFPYAITGIKTSSQLWAYLGGRLQNKINNKPKGIPPQANQEEPSGRTL